MKKLMSAIIAFALSVSALVPVFAADTFNRPPPRRGTPRQRG